MYDLISKLSFTRGLNIILIVFGVLISPFWFIYQFHSSLYQSLELSKLLVLALSIGIPICLAMTVANSLTFGKIKEEDEKKDVELRFMIMGLSCGFCGFTFYLPICLRYFFESITGRQAIELMLYAYAGAGVYSVYWSINRSIRKRRAAKLANSQSR